MTVINNPRVKPRATPLASGAVYIDRQKSAFKDLPALANGDAFLIGIVPAGCKLIPHLCALSIAKLDTHSSAGTAKVKIGTAGATDALVAETAATGAISALQSAFKAAEIGSPNEDVLIYATLSAAVATQATTGGTVFDLAYRAYDPGVDG